MSTIHWLGAGLSSAPGIHTLIKGKRQVRVWNRTLAHAEAILAATPGQASADTLDFPQLEEALEEGDVLVSMLPADMHNQVAELALARGAHFVSSSYVSPAMRALQSQAMQAGLCLVNEVGLDPGIDHLMAHALVDNYRKAGLNPAQHKLRFRSYCGGFPAVANDFRYKFSWSPLGVLRALKTPARCLQDGKAVDVMRPWDAISNYSFELPGGKEHFEAYPNRDSLPFIEQYGFDPDWQVDQFVRGTLRLPGWTEAWADLFAELETLTGKAGEARLAELSDSLWQAHRYLPGEADRVVLCVELEAVNEAGACSWYQACAIDAQGNETGSAMARLVSLPVALAVESVIQGEIAAGVSTAPAGRPLIDRWFASLAEQGDTVHWS